MTSGYFPRRSFPKEAALTENSLRLTLEPTVLAPRRARLALHEWLAGVNCPPDQRDLLVVISELVTNAVIHTGSGPDVRAAFDDGRVRLELHDQDQVPPVAPSASDGDGIGGRGSRLVAALTDHWGWDPTPTGKVIWTETLC